MKEQIMNQPVTHIVGNDLAFPYRLRYAADILREVDAYLNYPDVDTYKATQLDDLAAEYEAKLKELTHLAQQVGCSGAWTQQKATDLAVSILDAGYTKVDPQ